jgi:hypothetical protein
MITTLITALRAAETLETYHRERVEETTGTRQAYHSAAAKYAQDDIDDIRLQLCDGGTTIENQALAMRSLDMTMAWYIIDKRALPEWRASKQASQVVQALAQAIAEAIHAARDGDMLVRQTRQ